MGAMNILEIKASIISNQHLSNIGDEGKEKKNESVIH